MSDYSKLKDIGFTHNDIACYLALVANHPATGSQISRTSGIARSRVFEILRGLLEKGMVIEMGSGAFVPMPPDELIQRLKLRFESGLNELKAQLETISQETSHEFIWSIKGYAQVMQKAEQMIATAGQEIYMRLFSKEFFNLTTALKRAEQRKVAIRCIAMGEEMPPEFEIQVTHPDPDQLIQKIGGRSFDLICDQKEGLTGLFETNKENLSLIQWTQNRWVILTIRNYLRHDFYHCLLEKLVDRGMPLSENDQKIYALIKSEEVLKPSGRTVKT
jgi:HTH-type transcriptional regulator, sugar sensing transcriptional regulator